MKIKFSYLMFWLLVIAAACSSDPTPEVPVGSAGYFVVNEGGFGNNNTSISFYDRTSGAVTNDVFQAKNGRALGDQAQSLTVFDGKAYVVVQHSAKIEVINADDYSSIKTISDGIESPRYMLVVNSSKAYVSDWGADGVTGSVKVLDLGSMSVTKSIPTGKGPNEMLMKDGQVYVANTGGYDFDNTLSIIDTSKDEVTKTVEVGDSPNSLRFDHDGNLWVLSTGKFAYNEDYSIDEANSTKSTLSKVVNDAEVNRSFVGDRIAYPGASHLTTNNDGSQMFYIFDGEVHFMIPSSPTAGGPLIVGKYFYGLEVDPITNEIIACEAPDFSSPGKIYVYSIAGAEVRNFVVGIAPNGVGFK